MGRKWQSNGVGGYSKGVVEWRGLNEMENTSNDTLNTTSRSHILSRSSRPKPASPSHTYILILNILINVTMSPDQTSRQSAALYMVWQTNPMFLYAPYFPTSSVSCLSLLTRSWDTGDRNILKLHQSQCQHLRRQIGHNCTSPNRRNVFSALNTGR